MTFIKHLAITLAIALLAACSGGDIGSLAVTPNLSISGAEAANSGLSKTNNSYDYTVASNTPVKLICNAPCTFVASSVHASFTSVNTTNRTWQATLMGTDVAGVVTIAVKFPGQAIINVVVNVQPALTVKVTGLGAAAIDGSYVVANNKSVTVTCNMPCTFSATAINSTYSTPVVTGTSWTATVTKTGAAAPMKSSGSARVLSAIVAPTSSLTVTASAKGQVVAKAVFKIAAAAAPLNSVETVDLVKSANASNGIINNLFYHVRMNGTIHFGGATPIADSASLSGSTIAQCAVSGEVTYSFSVSNLTQRSVGDTFTTTYNQCDDGMLGGILNNGSFSVKLNQFTDSDNYSTESVITNFTQDYRGTTGFGYTTTPFNYGSIGTASGTFQYSVSSTNLPTFKVAQTMSGNVNVTLTNNFDNTTPSGTKQFVLTNIVRTLGQPTSLDAFNFTPNNIKFDANDSTYSYSVFNTAAIYVNNQNQIDLGTKGNAVITYGAASINVLTDYLTAEVSGINTDSTLLTPVTLTGLYFTTAAFTERGTPY